MGSSIPTVPGGGDAVVRLHEATYNHPNFESKKGNTITVAKSGGDYTTIATALAAASSGDVIQVYPDGGVGYSETNPLVIPTGVSLVGMDGPDRITISPTDVNSPLITMGEMAKIANVTLSGVTNSAGIYAPAGLSLASIADVVALNCSIGIESDCAGLVIVRGMTVQSGTGAAILRANAGGFIGATDLFVASGCTYIRGLVADGAGAYILVNNSALDGIVTDAIYAANGGLVRPHVMQVSGSPTNGIHIAATGGTIDGSSINLLDGSSAYDILIESATGVVEISSGRIDSTKISITAGAVVRGYYLEAFAQDKGTSIQGELHVGSPEQPAETVLGEGDSTTLNMVVKTWDGAATYVDVTADIVAGTPVTGFPGLGTGNALLIGNTSRKFPGWKDSISTAVVLGAGALRVRLSNGAGGWNTVYVMTSDADAPYDAHAQQIFRRVQNSQVRFDTQGTAWSSWAKDTYDGDSCYWCMIDIITAAITTAPVFDGEPASIKCHTNRYEVNADGYAEKFGAARYRKRMLVHQALTDPLTGAAPGNGGLAFSSTITLTPTQNRFANNTTDGFGQIIVTADGLDTSMPITLRIGWVPRVGGPATVELEASWRVHTPGTPGLGDGSLVDGSLVDDGTGTTGAVAIVAGDLNRLLVSEISGYVPDALPSNIVAFRLFRDATAGNAHDTLAGNVDIAFIQVLAWFWQ